VRDQPLHRIFTLLWVMGKDDQVQAPVGMALFPQDIARPSREWGERSYPRLRWAEMPGGGHFAAWEAPELLAQEVHAFFRQFRLRFPCVVDTPDRDTEKSGYYSTWWEHNIVVQKHPALTKGPMLLQLPCMTNVRCFSTRCLALQGELRDVWVKVS
jgi:hypothetical protein